MLQMIFDETDAAPVGERSSERQAGTPVMAASLGAPLGVPVCSDPPGADELVMFSVERRELHAHAAAKLGLAMLGADVSGRRLVIVEDFYRAAPCTAADGTTVLYGASARLVVDVAEFEAEAQLTLPVVAAEVQVGTAKAQFRLTAKGYKGPLSDVLVTPRELNVETYVELMGSIATLQKRLSDDTANIVPVPLFLDLPTSESGDADRRRAIGTSFALSQIADGRSLKKARSVMEWDTWTPEAKEAITGTYEEIVGVADADFKPSDAMKLYATGYLGPLRLRP